MPSAPLPSATFVKGRTPRPREGWLDEALAAAADDAATDDDVCFAYGCDLFDAGCYFEAHEAWERCWQRARNVDTGGVTDDARFIHGLIRLAAAGVKLLDDNDASRLAHVDGAATSLADIDDVQRGIAPATWRRAIADLRAGRRPRLQAPSR